MMIKSLVRIDGQLTTVEVEMVLAPGLPQIHFLGLADQGIKESILRIKSAIRQQGFDYPRAQQVIVNLRPNHFKKSSRGLELAVALALLIKTKQVAWPIKASELTVYGELSLTGEVHEPEDLNRFVPQENHCCVLTGTPETMSNSSTYFNKIQIKELRDLHTPSFEVLQKEKENPIWNRPGIAQSWLWSSRKAKLLLMMAVGRHHTLLAGPAGLGKTSLAQAVKVLLPTPDLDWLKSYLEFGDETTWWPEVSPHHTISHHGLLGGCAPIVPGEVSRAHGGILILDELLEFPQESLEALREPMQEGRVTLRKKQYRATFPAQAQFIATTNLCPCGKWAPGEIRSCYYNHNRCFSNLYRLSGPLLDRFQIVEFIKKEKNHPLFEQQGKLSGTYSFEQIFLKSQEAISFQAELRRYKKIKSQGHIQDHVQAHVLENAYEQLQEKNTSPSLNTGMDSYLSSNLNLSMNSNANFNVNPNVNYEGGARWNQWNSHLSEEQLQISQDLIEKHGLEELSPRRKISTLRVARTLADLEFCAEVQSSHLEEAREEWSVGPIQRLSQGSC